ncbi:MAG TPA: SWIM zinc finger family protein [Acidimicrobiales bacterium]|nr:SWIM zinc finger family protein [Acidimicrobiales bacterium]
MNPPSRRAPRRRPSGRGLAPGTRRGFGKTPWGAAWVNALETRARLDPNRLPRGRTYARWGHVGPLTVAPGRIEASVTGSAVDAYRVWIRVRELDQAEWERLLDMISAQVGHAAALLDGELPPELVEEARAAGVDLLPGPGDLSPRCSCPDWADPCKHAAAVCYLVADVLDADPFALLLLRGRSSLEVMAGLRARRATGATAVTSQEGSDRGVPAAAAFRRAQPSADQEQGRPALPAPPLPPPHPGAPLPLAADPPPASGLSPAGLAAVAADAARRAHALALGATTSVALELDRRSDLARWAAGLTGEGSRPGGLSLEALARAAGGTKRQLERDAQAWAEASPESADPQEPEGEEE